MPYSIFESFLRIVFDFISYGEAEIIYLITVCGIVKQPTIVTVANNFITMFVLSFYAIVGNGINILLSYFHCVVLSSSMDAAVFPTPSSLLLI